MANANDTGVGAQSQSSNKVIIGRFLKGLSVSRIDEGALEL